MNRLVLLLGIGVVFYGCEHSTVEDDLTDYCECIQMNNGPNSIDCVKIKEEMAVKYEYDPEAAEYIQENIGSCQ